MMAHIGPILPTDIRVPVRDDEGRPSPVLHSFRRRPAGGRS
jgi:hypothetical protein